MEPKSCIARYDAATDTFDLCIPTQGISDIKTALAQITGLGAGEVPHPLRRCRRRLRRSQRNLSGIPRGAARGQAHRQGRCAGPARVRKRSPATITAARADLTGELALDAEGKFLGLRVEWLVNLGAYCSSAGALINTVAAPTSSATSLYKRARRLRPAPAGLHQHHADHRLSRRRPPERRVSVGAAGRRSGGASSASIRSRLRRRNILPKSAFPDEDADRLTPTTAAIRRVCSIRRWRRRTGTASRRAARTAKKSRQAARHRACAVPRAVRRGRQGADRDPDRAPTASSRCSPTPVRRGRGSKPCFPEVVATGSRASPRTGSRCASTMWRRRSSLGTGIVRLALADQSRRRA